MVILGFLVVHWYLSLFCQTFFLHRYAAHKMFQMNFYWERLFYAFTYLTQGPSFLNPRAYSIMHQRHHQHSDTIFDPHSPQNFNNLLSLMKSTLKEYQATLKDYNPKDVKHIWPKWRFLDRWATSHYSLILWTVIYTSFYIFFAQYWWQYLFLPFHFLMGPIQGSIVNWFGHKLGYRNFSLKDKSRNTLFWDFFLLGELFQNNHHRDVYRWNFAVKWFEWDPTYYILKILFFFRIIKRA